MRILVAEDDEISLRLIVSMLEEWGYEAVSAKDGAEAWEILQRDDAPQIALLDWVMPEVDGVDLCRRIREAEHEPCVYTILLTAKGEREDILIGLDAGADDYVTKPFDPHELEVRLRAGRRIVDLQNQLNAARKAVAD